MYVRIAFKNYGTERISKSDLESKVNHTNILVRERYRNAEYVDDDSPWVSWESIRIHGYSCRAFCYIIRR